MSIALLNQAIACQAVEHSAKSVLMVLAWRANDAGEVKIDLADLAKQAGWSYDATKKAVQLLRKIGLVEGSKTYRLNPCLAQFGVNNTPNGVNITPSIADDTISLGVNNTPNGVNITPPLIRNNKQTLLNTLSNLPRGTTEMIQSQEQPSEDLPKSLEALAHTSPETPATPAPEIPTPAPDQFRDDTEMAPDLFADSEPIITNEQVLDEWFAEFWQHYAGPRKADKAKCKAKYAAIIAPHGRPEFAIHQAIMLGLSRHLDCDQWAKDNGKWIPAPLVFLNRSQWEATPAPSMTYNPNRNRIPSQYRENGGENNLPF
jgi:hypothetical protein